MAERLPFNQSLIRILRDVPYYRRLVDLTGKQAISILGSDPEAGVVSERHADGRIEIALRFPIDDNADPTDGRLYLRDTFVFAAKDRSLIEHRRNLEPIFNRVLSPIWKHRWSALQGETQTSEAPDSPQIQKFARQLYEVLPTSLPRETRKVIHAHRDFFNESLQSLLRRDPNWTLRVGKIAHGFWSGPERWTMALPAYRRNDSPLNRPELWLQLQFDLDPEKRLLKTGKIHWRLGSGLSQDRRQEMKALAEALNQDAQPIQERFRKFWEFTKNSLLPIQPKPRLQPDELRPISDASPPKDSRWEEFFQRREAAKVKIQASLEADFRNHRIQSTPWEKLIHEAGNNLLDPIPILVMGSASLFGGVSRALATRAFGASRLLAGPGARAFGLAMEAAGVTMLNRGLRASRGDSPLPAISPLRELLANAILLGSIRMPHSGVNRLIANRPATSRIMQALPAALGFAGATLSSGINRRLGLASGCEKPWHEEILEGSVSWMHAMVGWNLANRASNHGLQKLLKEMQAKEVATKKSQAIIDPVPAQPALFKLAPLPPVQPGQNPRLPDAVLRSVRDFGKQFDLFVPDQGELFLDSYLFSGESHLIRLRRTPSGTGYQIRDDRVLQVALGKPGDERIFDLGSQMPLFIDNRLVAMKNWTPLETNQIVSFMPKAFHLQIPSLDPFLKKWNQMDAAAQGAILEDLAYAKNAFQARAGGTASELAERLSAVWSGERSIYSLPAAGGLQEKMLEIMTLGLNRLRQEGIDPHSVRLSRDFDMHRLDLETDFHRAVAAKNFSMAMATAANWGELRLVLRNCGLSQVDGHDIEYLLANLQRLSGGEAGDIHMFPRVFGFRQKIRDLTEQANFQRYFNKAYSETLNWIRNTDLASQLLELARLRWEMVNRIRDNWKIEDKAPPYAEEQVVELVDQVLDRDKPLEWLTEFGGIRKAVMEYQKQVVRLATRQYPDQMRQSLDPYSGEAVRSSEPQSQYRYATHLLNANSNRPVRGLPSLRETRDFVAVVAKHLDSNISTYLEAQALLRCHLDAASKPALKMLEKAGAREKTLILDSYFGDFRRRDLPAGIAFQTAVLMGMAGMYREVGVTYRINGASMESTLSLGDLSFVRSEHYGDYFLMHSHPEEYLNRAGNIMGQKSGSSSPGEATFYFGETSGSIPLSSSDNRNILFSEHDVRLFFQSAKSYWRYGYPGKFGSTPLYEATGRVFKNFVFHPYGASEIRIPLSEKGDPEKIHIRYTLRKGFYGKGENYLRHLGRLLSLNRELGVSLSSERIDNEAFIQNLPFPVKTLF